MLSNPPTRTLTIDDGPKGTLQTLNIMCRLVKVGKKHPALREFTANLVRPLRQKDFNGEILKCFDFVQNCIRYTRDIRDVETIYTPEKILENGYGDCDDKCVLLASMLEAIAHPTRFVACGFDPLDKNKFTHVFLDTRRGGKDVKWISLDPTMDHAMGWRPPNIQCSIVVYN